MQTVDVLCVGSGPGSLVGALRAKAKGLEPLVIEQSRYVGGTSTQSFGALWFPGNHRQRERGQDDSVEDGLLYLTSVVGEAGPSANRARQEAYLRGGLRMLRFLGDCGLTFVQVADYPDYFAEAPGGRSSGRILNSPMIDARRLGPWRDWVRPRRPLPLNLIVPTIEEFKYLGRAATSPRAAVKASRTVFRSSWLKLRGARPLVMGAAYIGQLLLATQQAQIRVERNTSLIDLLVENDRVVGARVERAGRQFEIRARRGVLLNTGGFAHNGELREKFGPHPASTDWTWTIEEDRGDAVRVATALGAATSNLDEAYWLPMLIGASGGTELFLAERHQPHSLMVDASGARYTDEAADYMSLGRAMYDRHLVAPAVPSWLIVDSQHRRRYPLASTMPRIRPNKWIESGYLKEAGTIADLANACGIEPANLERTVSRFNDLGRRGVDEDFGRGSTLYDRVYGDPTHLPNPCLGTVERPPFYAAQVVPGDIGMAGGLVTDEHGAVLREDGTRIPALFACGTAAASAMGRVYAGGGISLGQSSVFGFLATEFMINQPVCG